MNEQDRERMKKLLRQSLPPVNSGDEPGRDLWPEVLRQLDVNLATKSGDSVSHGWVWFDGALAAGIVGLVAIFPAAIPMFLYYL
jgi:hypothetical protein